MALRDTFPSMTAFDEASFKSYYDSSNDLYVALYGCNDCYQRMEQAAGNMKSSQRFLYDDGLDYTDGFVMQAAIQFATPDEDIVDATINGLCLENLDRNNLKSCWNIKWRND